MTRRQKREISLAFVVGAAATALSIALYLLGLLDWIERRAFDLRVRYANRMPEHPDITCIDVDDGSIELHGRWPWPRDRQASLIAVAAELGARTLIVDLEYTEQQAVREDVPEDADLLIDPLTLRDENLQTVFPDEELRAAIRDAGSVYLAVHDNPKQWQRSEEFGRMVQAAARGESLAPSPRLLKDAELRAEDLIGAARLAADLLRTPTVDPVEAGAKLGLSSVLIDRVSERCREHAMSAHVRAAIRRDPTLKEIAPSDAARRLLAAIAPGIAYRDETPVRKAVLKTWRDALSSDATLNRPLFDPAKARAAAPRSSPITPAYFLHASAARRCGFVSVEPDGDGVIRRCTLLARTPDGGALGQLAFTAACDILGASPEDIAVESRAVTLRPPGAASLRIQLDRDGRTVIPWLAKRDWTQQFGRHIPAAALMQVAENRKRIADNERRLRSERQKLYASLKSLPECTAYREAAAERDALEHDLPIIRYRPDSPSALTAARERLAKLDARMAELERTMRAAIAASASVSASTATQAVGSLSPQDAQRAGELLAQLDAFAERIAAANARLRNETDGVIAELRPRIAGKHCLIGYAATALADMTPIPTHPRAPGVLAHANLLNGLLTGRLVRWSTTGWNVSLAVAFGMLASVMSALLRPRAAMLALLAALLVFASVAWALYYAMLLWLVVTPSLAAAVSSFAAIAIYRYIFIDAERRHLATALGQYTSKQIARQVAENPELAGRAEMREVTSMFTDLIGFTTISERIGAERTQRVLNLCLGRFTDVLLRNEGLVNKFIGDGIFAFWNPVIHPQADHARRACEAAIELLDALDALRQAAARHIADDAFAELRMRIGVATGNAVVGPCGSEQKYDYTCIGDSVNVAARLESANRFYGTEVLVNEHCRRQAGEGFAFRALGAVRVKGKLEPVQIFELLGRVVDVRDEDLDYARRFDEAVQHFQSREWPLALRQFESLAKLRPADVAAETYRSATALLIARPPDAGWNGAIELAEK